jgi:hypothetical protein
MVIADWMTMIDRMTRGIRRFLVFQAFLLWQGGFLFYAAVVVPVGTNLHGELGQGLVTQRVTDILNIVGVGWAVVVGWDIAATGNRRRKRFLAWLVCVGLLAIQAGLHVQMDSQLLTGSVRDLSQFRPLHIAYLWASTIQWLFATGLGWLTLRSWEAVE